LIVFLAAASPFGMKQFFFGNSQHFLIYVKMLWSLLYL
jgi:hypothetical protein